MDAQTPQDQNFATTETVKCPNCGALLKYDIASGNLKCEHCAHTQPIAADVAVARRELNADIMQKRESWADTRVYKCQNCGAKAVIDPKKINQTCVFCGSSNVVITNEIAGIKPDSIIPFQISPTQIEPIFKTWLKHRKFAPRMFKTEDIRESVMQTYCPVWCFCANTNTAYNGTVGRHETYTKTTRGSDGKMYSHTETRTVWFNIAGTIYRQYTDFLIQSSDKISAQNFNKLKPFDLSLVKPYRAEFLMGLNAQHYTRDLETCFNDFGAFVRGDVRREIIHKHNADVVKFLDMKTAYTDKKFNYTLLPLFIAHYKYKKKVYNFFINGISGKLVGKSPLSLWKILFTSLFAGALVGILAFLGYHFLY